ncbi:MFS general substrate transporter, partial [Tilletiaria anomala UBC 951]
FFFVTLGLVYSFGVTQRVLIQRGFASASVLGWVSAITVVYSPLLAIPLQMLVLRWGNRITGQVGAILTGTGYIATSFCFSQQSKGASKLAPLFLAQSLFGVGYAFVFWSCNSIAAQWFPARRVGLAIGIVYAGSGLGGAFFSILLSQLVERIGLENALRAYGALALGTLVPASAFLKTRQAERGQEMKIHWHLARDRKFSFLFGATSLVTFSLFVPPFFLPTYASSAGFSPNVGAWLVAGYNLSSAVGRILFGILSDSLLGPVTTLTLCIFLFGATILSIWLLAASSLVPLIAFILLNGAAGGALLSLQPAVSASVWSEHGGTGGGGGGRGEMQSVLAMTTSGRVFGSLLGAPLAGYLLDTFGGAGFGTGAYRPALLFVGCISFLACASLYGLRWSVVGWSIKKRV